MKKKKKETVKEDSEDDSDDDYGIAETNCELAMVESQLCSIPYELYDLTDVMRILSTETWDSFLTEEERFFLSSFLPDMDQGSFGLTMRELLGGANLYFGNPVDKFYKSLRGGLFTPKVACCKEGVVFFKRRRYYYYLKRYHDKTIKTFTEMQRLWNQYGKGLSSNARVLLWSERRRTGNRRKLLDLNRVPSEEIYSKNTLKLKITSEGIFQYQDQKHHQSLPKGLLKITPKYSTVLREPYVAQEIHETGSKSRISAASPYGTIVSSSISELPKCILNHQDTSLAYLKSTSQSSIDKTGPDLGASITEQNLLTKREDYDYPHYRLKSPGFNPRILDTSSETMETKMVLSGTNFQRDANVVRKPLLVLREDNHAQQTDNDHLFSVTYKRRKVQRIGVA